MDKLKVRHLIGKHVEVQMSRDTAMDIIDMMRQLVVNANPRSEHKDIADEIIQKFDLGDSRNNKIEYPLLQWAKGAFDVAKGKASGMHADLISAGNASLTDVMEGKDPLDDIAVPSPVTERIIDALSACVHVHMSKGSLEHMRYAKGLEDVFRSRRLYS